MSQISKDEMMFILMNLGNEKFIKIKSALSLQELVIERIKGSYKSGHKKLSDEVGYLEQELQSLVEESEIIDKS